MDADNSNLYVAELLQQLEDLKRKKARRLQKLKKLKKSSTCPQENVAKDISCRSIENISVHSDEKESTSGSKCVKCGLCLISKDSPCIQCISAAECKENKGKRDSENTIIALKVESGNSEKETVSCPVVLENGNGTKSTFKQKQTEKISSLNGINEVQNCDSSHNVAEHAQNKIIFTNTNDSTELSRIQRKRFNAVEDDLDQGEQCDHKKLKLSRDILQNNIPNTFLSTGDAVNEQSEVSSVDDLNEFDGKEKPKDVIDDSLFQNMSCFLSSSLLVEDEDNVERDIGNPTEEFITEISTESTINMEGNVKLSEIYVKEISNSSTFKKVKDNAIELLNLDTVHAEHFNDSGQKHTLDNKLLSKPDVHCDSSHKQPMLETKKVNNTVKSYESTLNCVPDAENIKEHNIEVEEDMCEGLSSDSQFVKDLKASDFSSFENSSSIEKVQLEADVEPENIEDNQTNDLLDVPNSSTIKISYVNGIVVENKNVNSSDSKAHIEQKEVEYNETPSLLNTCKEIIHNQDDVANEDDLICIPETSAMICNKVSLQIDETEQLFDADDALTADIDFECTSLEVPDTLDDLLTKSSTNHDGSASYCDKPTNVSIEYTSIDVLELNPPDAEVFTIPDTVLLETSHKTEIEIKDNKSKNKDAFENPIKCPDYQAPIGKDVRIEIPKIASCLPNKEQQSSSTYNAYATCDIFEETQCDSLDQLQTIQDTVFFDAEDSLALGNYKDIPFIENGIKKTSSSDLEETLDIPETIIKFLCCLQSEIEEPVNDVKLVTFNNSSYAFIQHVTWIQVWRQEESRDWIKIFSHQVDDKLKLKEICFTKDDKHLVLIMLLSGDQVHCLQFLLFESEARVIKLMEHTHWMQNRCPEDTVLLCGLGDLKFATAQGKETFEVFVHVFSSLADNPRLAMVTLGSTASLLHSLCKIEKLPNALMGTSHSTLYVWHLLEARLVTSVSLQLPNELSIEKCIWATIETGLVFFMTVCEGKDQFRSCQLLATNLATGFCQTAMSYSFLPSKEMESINDRSLKAVYNEPFLAVSCEDGCFLWSVSEEYCCAALGAEADVTAVNIGSDRENKILVAVGNITGCVNCYSIKCS